MITQLPVNFNALGLYQKDLIRGQELAEILRVGQSRLLEMIANDAPLESTLDSLLQLIESQSDGVLCSVLLMDDSGQHLLHCAAPSLPKSFCDAIHGVAIGENVGSCGTAAFRRSQVIVHNISTSPLWTDFASIAITHNLRACWSTPIISFKGKLLGTFAMYYTEPRNPGAVEMGLISVATHIAGIAIERIKKEQELRRYAQGLEDLVNERTAELRSAKELAEANNLELFKVNKHLNGVLNNLKIAQNELVSQEKLASLGALVSDVAHELNTPIGNALTIATTMEDIVQQIQIDFESDQLRKSTLKEFIKQTVEMTRFISHSCTRAASLIQSFKQVAIDQSSEQKRQFDLNTLVNDNISALLPSFKNAPWQVDTNIENGIICDSYPGPLGQVIANLIQNSINHGFEGRAYGKILISATHTNHIVEMSISDDGAGIESAVLDHIFDPFFTTKIGRGGSGLGLSISRNIVTNLLGGSLQVSSELGKGCRFILTFPKMIIEKEELTQNHPISNLR